MKQILTTEQFNFHFEHLMKRFFGNKEQFPGPTFEYNNYMPYEWARTESMINDPETDPRMMGILKILRSLGCMGYLSGHFGVGNWSVINPVLLPVSQQLITKESLVTLRAVYQDAEYQNFSIEGMIETGGYAKTGYELCPLSYTADSFLAHALGNVDPDLTYGKAMKIAKVLRGFGIGQVYQYPY